MGIDSTPSTAGWVKRSGGNDAIGQAGFVASLFKIVAWRDALE